MKILLRSAAQVLGTVAIVVFLAWITIAQPSCHRNGASQATVDPLKLREHVETFSQRLGPRDWHHPENLNRCAAYIAQHFSKAGATVVLQPVIVSGRQYQNVIGKFNTDKGSSVIVGAHYDTCGELPGADDNASGVAALIELAYLLGNNTPTSTVELVAYVLEEPPIFGTESMGSAVHAKSIADNKESVIGVIVLEMVGYFKDDLWSQTYPNLLFRLMYPSRANFISVASRWDQGNWIKKVKAGMAGATDLPVYSMRAPSIIQGIDFSDHINYWPHGIKALMITDTAFYRNKAYHSPDDTADRLDYNRLSKVVVAVFEAVKLQARH